MKKTHIIIIVSLVCLNFLNAQITFNWDTDPVDNGDNVTETISGITTTFIGSSTAGFMNAGNYGGSSGNVVINSIDGAETTTSVTFNFSESVDVVSVLAIEGYGNSMDFTFTPVGGSNQVVVASLVEGIAQVDLNWTGVTSFTVSSSGSTFAFDNLILNSSSLSTSEFGLKKIKVFPNPSSGFIQISGVTNTEKYSIYNILGAEVISGSIGNQEKIDVRNIKNGMYVLKFDSGQTLKFLKK